MTFRVSFKDGTHGLARVLQDVDGKLVMAMDWSGLSDPDGFDMDGGSWQIWSLDWVVDVGLRLMPHRILNDLDDASREAIRGVVATRFRGQFMPDNDGWSMAQFFRPIATAPRFRLVAGKGREQRAIVISVDSSQPLPGVFGRPPMHGSLADPRYMILDPGCNPIEFGSLKALMAGPEDRGGVFSSPDVRDLIGERFLWNCEAFREDNAQTPASDPRASAGMSLGG